MEETEHHPSKRSGTGLFLGQTGNGLAELEQRTRHLLLPLLPRDWRGKEVAMASAVSVHPTSPGCMLVCWWQLSASLSKALAQREVGSRITAMFLPMAILAEPCQNIAAKKQLTSAILLKPLALTAEY